jgi:hypothetical protein
MGGISTNGFVWSAAGSAQNGDAATAAAYTAYADTQVAWLTDPTGAGGYWPAGRGAYGARGFVGCEPPGNAIPPNITGECLGDTYSARFYLGETGGMMFAWKGDPIQKASIDDMFTAAWAKAGFVSPSAGDGANIIGIENNGYFLGTLDATGATTIAASAKYFGGFFGLGDNQAWAILRQGAAVDLSPRSTSRGGISRGGIDR